MQEVNEEDKTLTFISWYSKTAVYFGDTLIYYGEVSASSQLLQLMGFKCVNVREIPTHDIPVEFDKDIKGNWTPPKSLFILKSQHKKWEQRKRRQRIQLLKDELEELEQEESLALIEDNKDKSNAKG